MALPILPQPARRARARPVSERLPSRKKTTVWAPWRAPVGRVWVSLFWRLGPGPGAFLPAPVRTLLATAAPRAELIEVVGATARYANLSNEQRRLCALAAVGDWLRARRIDLTEQERALLVELLYGWIKRRRPGRIVPPPARFGPRFVGGVRVQDDVPTPAPTPSLQRGSLFEQE